MLHLDDVIFSSRNVEEHLDNLENVLWLVQNAGMKIKLKKCFFMHGSIHYLGHTVKLQELSVAPKTIDAFQKMTPTATETKLRSFLGVCNVYRRLVKDFASIAASVNKKLKKLERNELKLSKDQMTSFDELKKRLKAPPARITTL